MHFNPHRIVLLWQQHDTMMLFLKRDPDGGEVDKGFENLNIILF